MEALRLPPDEVEAELRKELALALYHVACSLQAKHVPLLGRLAGSLRRFLGNDKSDYTEKNLE